MMNRFIPSPTTRLVCLTAFAAVLSVCFFCDTARAAKNVIIMIADGAGHNTWAASEMYRGQQGREVYQQSGWVRLSACTYPLNLSSKPTGNLQQDKAIVYDPLKAWSVEPSGGKGSRFAGYAYLTKTPTDSAAAATALASGQKTFNNAINWTNDNRSMQGQTIAEIAKAHGKSAGVITSVPLSHATPAGLGGAHNKSRNHYADIAKEMLDAPYLDVIMGAGNPDFDENGRALKANEKHNYDYVGGEKTWNALKQGRQGGWKLVQTKADFERLTTGDTPPKVLGVAQAASTLQERRGPGMAKQAYDKMVAKLSHDGKTPEPFAAPMNKNVPTLAVMARAAINCLDDNPKGFYLMIEGGAVDWANHANQPDRMIEEQVDYVKAVEAVCDWVEKNSNWDDTLLILTADHETGLIWGPKSDRVAFEPIADNGAGHIPGLRYNTHGHSNSLVPLYARGAGSERFAELTKGMDEKAAAAWHYSGKYVENTDIFAVMKAEVR